MLLSKQGVIAFVFRFEVKKGLLSFTLIRAIALNAALRCFNPFKIRTIGSLLVGDVGL